jgi:hypothetical protein
MSQRFGFPFLAAFGLLLVALAAPALAQDATAAGKAAGIDLSYIPADAAIAAVTYPSRLLSAPEMEWWPIRSM